LVAHLSERFELLCHGHMKRPGLTLPEMGDQGMGARVLDGVGNVVEYVSAPQRALAHEVVGRYEGRLAGVPVDIEAAASLEI
jgi:hypothetical protein